MYVCLRLKYEIHSVSRTFFQWSVHATLHPSIYPSICPSIYISAYLSVWQSSEKYSIVTVKILIIIVINATATVNWLRWYWTSVDESDDNDDGMAMIIVMILNSIELKEDGNNSHVWIDSTWSLLFLWYWQPSPVLLPLYPLHVLSSYLISSYTLFSVHLILPYQIVSGIEYCHYHKIVHRDLKPEVRPLPPSLIKCLK